MAVYRGLMKALVIVMRRSSKQIDILVDVKVAKIYEPLSSVQ